MLHGYANPLKRLDTSESVNLHKYLILLDSCRIHATRRRELITSAPEIADELLWMARELEDKATELEQDDC